MDLLEEQNPTSSVGQLCFNMLRCMAADRGMRRAYQMQEEDFPPLLSRSQGATGFATAPNSSASNAATRVSQYQKPYVNVTLSPPSCIPLVTSSSW